MAKTDPPPTTSPKPQWRELVIGQHRKKEPQVWKSGMADLAADSVNGASPKVTIGCSRITYPQIQVEPRASRFANGVLPNPANNALELKFFVVTNIGTAPLTLNPAASVAGADFLVELPTDYQGVLAPQASTRIGVRFKPSSRGEKQDTLTIPSNAVNPAEGTAQVSGLGTEPLIQAIIEAEDYGDLLTGGDAVVRKLTVTNVGDAPLEIRNLVLEDGKGDAFEIPAVGVTLANNGDAKECDIPFKPVNKGVSTATLKIDSNARNQAPTFSLKASVKQRIKPVIELSAPAVVVKGKRRKITLKIEGDVAGKGTFSVLSHADKIKLFKGGTDLTLADGKAVFDLPGPTELEVEAAGASPFEGIELKWEPTQLPDMTLSEPAAATAKLTAVKATLDVFRKSGTALTAEEKSGDGRVVHLQNAKKERARAKIVIACEPREYAGTLKLQAIKDGMVSVFDAPKDGKAVNLSDPIKPADTPLTWYVEGTTLSKANGETGLKLGVTDEVDEADSAKITVVKVTLDVHDVRPTADQEPPVIAEDKKVNPGRALYKQHLTQFYSPRARVRLTKAPHDAPCKLVLKAGGGQVRLFPADREKHKVPDPKNSLDLPEAPVALPIELGPKEVPDKDGLVYYAEGLDVIDTAPFLVDIDEVDEACDQIAFKVLRGSLEVEVERSDKAKLSQPVKLDLDGPTVKAADVPKDSGKVTVADLDIGYYQVKLKPQGAEAAWRIERDTPKGDGALLEVLGPPAKAKYVLRPKYARIQFVAYFIRTGLYIGTDIPANFSGDAVKAAEDDIANRCKIMKEAIKEARTAAGVDAAEDVLKIFVAPEFYFRGKAGAYPYETLSEIMPELRKETDDDLYKDWLFVFGSAIGSRDTDKKRKDVTGTVSKVVAPFVISVHCEQTSPAVGVKKDWKLWTATPNGQFNPVPGTSEFNIDDSSHLGTGGTREFYDLKFNANPIFNPKADIALWSGAPHEMTLETNKATFVEFEYTGTDPLAQGWTFRQGSITGTVVTPPANSGGNLYQAAVEATIADTIAAGPAQLVDLSSKTHAIDVKSLHDHIVFLSCPSGSPAAALKNGWNFFIADSSGVWTKSPAACRAVLSAKPTAASSGRKRFMVNLPDPLPLTATSKVGVHPELPYPAEHYKGLKWMSLEVDFSGPVAVTKGWFVEQGTSRGSVESATLISGNKYDIRVAMSMDADLTTGASITFADPGESEILNVAFVAKGGSTTPVGADGANLKDLLVYKESISSVDFEGMDYGRQAFYSDDRHMIKIHDDQGRRALRTDGADGTMGKSPNVTGTTRTWTDAKGVTRTGKVTEVNTSGLGGGTVFTMDDIVFGLEVCLDHGDARLKNYYATPEAKGQPKVQVQLIPSCGMSIQNPECVSDGLVFNVDAYDYAAKKGGGATAMTPVTKNVKPPIPGGLTIATFFPDEGEIAVYAPEPMPKKEIA